MGLGVTYNYGVAAWISDSDPLPGGELAVFVAAVENAALSGPVNGVSANPVRNAEFTKTLARQPNAWRARSVLECGGPPPLWEAIRKRQGTGALQNASEAG